MIFKKKKTSPSIDSAFSSIDIVGQCLVDEERTKLFKKFINKFVKKNDTVVDLGSGSGILALFAAKSAKKVFAVEFDPYVASIAQGNFDLNRAKNIELIISDARSIKFKKVKKFDVVIAEMLTTGIVDEFQVQAINNLHDQGLVDESTRFIPERQHTYATLVNVNSSFFGKPISMVLHLWKWHNWSNLKLKKLSDEKLLGTVDFRYKNEERLESELIFQISNTGILNGMYLTSKSMFDTKNFVGDTEALNAPIFIPITPIRVKKGDKVTAKVSYEYGGGYGSFSLKVLKSK
jgi:predicted RNA methylase